MISAGLTGFFTSFSLILAIGAQNAFVLRQGLRREHVFWLCAFCSVSDAVLITLGISGFSFLISLSDGLIRYTAMAGAAFLLTYGFFRFYAAWNNNYEVSMVSDRNGLAPTIAIAAALTWANPHVYLDTVALIGAVSTGFTGNDRLSFGVGAVSASFIFFFSLGYGARFLAPFMQSPRAWRKLDILIGMTMWWLAAVLLLKEW